MGEGERKNVSFMVINFHATSLRDLNKEETTGDAGGYSFCVKH